MSARLKYGYLWWMIEYPYKGATVQAFFASGNGGNEVVVIPALDLVIAAYGANYNEAAGWSMVTTLIPPVGDIDRDDVVPNHAVKDHRACLVHESQVGAIAFDVIDPNEAAEVTLGVTQERSEGPIRPLRNLEVKGELLVQPDDVPA